MKKVSLFSMVALYVGAGANHFVHPSLYAAIVPPWLGWHQLVVTVSGAFEIIFGLLLIPRRTRTVAAWGIIGLLFAVFPANIQMMLNYWHQHQPGLWLTVARLPLQFVLMAWAYGFTKYSGSDAVS